MRSLSKIWRSQLYLQEALTNVARHAEAESGGRSTVDNNLILTVMTTARPAPTCHKLGDRNEGTPAVRWVGNGLR
jgi:hypothetical protein